MFPSKKNKINVEGICFVKLGSGGGDYVHDNGSNDGGFGSDGDSDANNDEEIPVVRTWGKQLALIVDVRQFLSHFGGRKFILYAIKD